MRAGHETKTIFQILTLHPLRPPLATLGGFIFRVLVSLRVCRKTVRTYNVGDPDSSIKLSLPGTDPVHAQRRK